ncbi:hypothetical protein AAMO2058_001054100 [Amorphochlora amoebiformis]|uniref:Uncharacterized protein n=1 Tax=Amorphochlora amoebiformis TaxID=1561963 RepID=A0A7S0DMD0_9EUKA|mmetsp:Transcript_34368/g.55352  ORF Transcript_34368/g.55352 Transcript_34368/m.55352 type:complete len:324 (+) Transcript_34368:164-1135(+)
MHAADTEHVILETIKLISMLGLAVLCLIQLLHKNRKKQTTTTLGFLLAYLLLEPLGIFGLHRNPGKFGWQASLILFATSNVCFGMGMAHCMFSVIIAHYATVNLSTAIPRSMGNIFACITFLFLSMQVGATAGVLITKRQKFKALAIFAFVVCAATIGPYFSYSTHKLAQILKDLSATNENENLVTSGHRSVTVSSSDSKDIKTAFDPVKSRGTRQKSLKSRKGISSETKRCNRRETIRAELIRKLDRVTWISILAWTIGVISTIGLMVTAAQSNLTYEEETYNAKSRTAHDVWYDLAYVPILMAVSFALIQIWQPLDRMCME